QNASVRTLCSLCLCGEVLFFSDLCAKPAEGRRQKACWDALTVDFCNASADVRTFLLLSAFCLLLFMKIFQVLEFNQFNTGSVHQMFQAAIGLRERGHEVTIISRPDETLRARDAEHG